jgi:hypothetical protein
MTKSSAAFIDFGAIGSQNWTVLGLAAAVCIAIAIYVVKRGDGYSTTVGVIGIVAIAALGMYLASQTDDSDSKKVAAAKAETQAAKDGLRVCESRMDALEELIVTKLDRTTSADGAHTIGEHMKEILEREGCGSRSD